MSKIALHSNWFWAGGLLLLGLGCTPVRPAQISYVQSDQNEIKTIWLVTIDGSKKEEALPWLGGTDENFAWLPDGTSLYAWALESPGKSGNYLLASLDKGPGPCVTCSFPQYTGWPIPSPQGDRIVVISNTSSGAKLYIENFDGADFHEVEIGPNIVTISREPAPRLHLFPR